MGGSVRSLSVPVLIIALHAGCAGGESAAERMVVRDSAGVTIVDSPAPRAEWRLSAEPELRVGVVDGEPAYQFNRVAFAARLADGAVVVANGGTLDVRWFNADGRHRATAGGRGAGPREFRAFSSVLLAAGDTLLAWDDTNRRITVLAPDGSIAAGHAVTWNGMFRRPVSLLGLRADGRALITDGPLHDLAELRAGYRFMRDSVRVIAATLDGSAADTLVRSPSAQSVLWLDERGGAWRSLQMELPFGHSTHHALLGDMIVRAVTDRDQLELLDGGGVPRRIIRRLDARPAPLGAAERDRYVAAARELAEARNPANAATVADGARERLAHLPSDHVPPRFDRVLTDGAGHIWVRDHLPAWAAAEPQRWIVFSGEGAAVAAIRVPGELTVMHVGPDHVTGVIRDALDVEYVVVFGIERERP